MTSLGRRMCSSSAGFKVLHEEIAYGGYRKVIKRTVEFPDGKPKTFDILGASAPSVLVFPWDNVSKTATLIREYQPGSNTMQFGVVAGAVESKHKSVLQCAQHELNEEAHLESEVWIPLLNPDCSVNSSKYSENSFFPYLALNCTEVANPLPLDAEEWITIHPNITIDELDRLIDSGEMSTSSAYVVMLAMRYMRKHGYLDK